MEKRATQAEKALKEVQKDFAEYKEEKHKNDEIVNKELSDAKSALNEARTKAIKLTSQDEYNTERFKIAQGNADAYKKQAKILEERSSKMSAIVAKHEETMEVLRNEVAACQMKQSQAEVELQHLRHERSILKAAEARMIQENEILHRQKNSSAMVMENLNLVKLSLEKAEEEKSMRLRNKNEDLEKEVNLLRKKIDTEQEEYKESVKAWEKSSQELRDKLEEAQKAERERQEEIVALEKKMDLLRQELGETQEKLDMANSTLASRGVTAIARQDSNPEVSAKVRDLQMQLNQAKNEVITLKEQLTVARDSTTQYKDIADSAEKRLTESNNASKTLKDDLEARLAKATAEKEAVVAQLAEAKEVAERDTGAATLAEAKTAVDQLRNQLEMTAQELDVAKRISTESRAELQKQMGAAREAQEKYQRELLLHAKDIEELTTLKSSMTARQAELSEIAESKRAAEEARDKAVAVMAETESTHKAEYEKLKEQFGVVEEENKSLHDQLGTVTQQMTSLQRHFEGDPNASRSFSEDESRSTEQLMQIIKYLRREKEILSSKIDVVQAESVRIKSQMEVKERELGDATAALTAERAKGSSSEISSGRYADLLQKVQTVSALTDSNRMLREEKAKLDGELATSKTENINLTAELGPLREKVRTTDEREEALKLEMQALRQDNSVWKARAEQLVEKQQKINPEELKKLQVQNSELARKLSTTSAQLQKGLKDSIELGNKCKSQQEELGKSRAELAQKQEEASKLAANIEKLRANAQAKLSNLGASVREKDAAVKQLQAEKESLTQELEKERSSAKAAGEQKVAEASKTMEEINTIKATLAKKEGEIAQLKKQNDDRQTTLIKLRKLGRDYKEKYEKATAEVNELKASGGGGPGDASAEEVAKLKEEVKALKEDNESQLEMLDGVNSQIEEHEEQVKEYEEKIEELNGEVTVWQQKFDKFKDMLIKIKNTSEDGEPSPMAQLASETEKRVQIETEFESYKKASHRQLKNLHAEKATLTKERAKERQELQSRIEELEKKATPSSLPAATPAAEKPAPETVSVKPQVSSAPKQQQQPRQKQAIQAHVQPSLRPHPPATATIRPQRGVPRPAAAAPQSQSPSSSDATVPQVTVPPTVVSVSPSQQATSSAPSTSTVPPVPTSVAAPITPASTQAQQLSASAAEFVPRTSEAAPSVVVPVTAATAVTTEQPATVAVEEATPTASTSEVVPQQEAPQVQQPPDFSAGSSQGPSTSAAKRPRDADEGEDVETKKARTTAEGGATADDDVVVLSSEDEEAEDQQEEGDEDGEVDEEMGAEEEDGVEDEEDQDEGAEEEVGDEEEDEEDDDVEEVEGVENVDEDSSSQLRIAEEDESVARQPEMEVVGDEEDSQAELPPAVPSGASESSQQNVFASSESMPEQQPDDGVVPSPHGMSEPVAEVAAPAAAVPVSVAPPTFQFSSTAAPTAAASSSAATSMDSTAVDFSQFAGSPAQPPSFAALAAQVPGGSSSGGETSDCT